VDGQAFTRVAALDALHLARHPWCMPRTNIVLDERLVQEAKRLTGAATKRQVVDIALRQLVARESAQRALRKLRGKLEWTGDVGSWRRSRG